MKFLSTTQPQVDAMNETLPDHFQLGTVQLAGGSIGLGVDLLTDCGPGQTYAAIGDTLHALPIIDGEPIQPTDV